MTAATNAGWPPLIVTVAPTGAHKTKADHPALPMTADEIAATAAACHEAGAAMIHLHVRDREGGHTLDSEVYRDVIAAVRREAGDDFVVQVTSEAAGRYTREQQMAMVRALRPEAVSLAVREIVPDGACEPEAAAFLAWLSDERILPQYVVYSAEEVTRYHDLCGRGVIPGERNFLLFVLGRYSAAQTSQPRDLLPFVDAYDDDSPWAVCAFGPREGACVMTAAALGGHVRVGFENNLWLSDGSLAPDNAALVAQARAGAALLGRRVADARTTRHMLIELVDSARGGAANGP